MKFHNKTIPIKTKGAFHFVDLTNEVKDLIEKSRVKHGLVNIQTLHTTTAVFVNENEPLLLKDIKRHLEKFAPRKLSYHHDNFAVRTVNMCSDECDNGHAHCKALIMPTNVVLNLIEGMPQLGRWQRILFVELDRPRERRIQIQIIGK